MKLRYILFALCILLGGFLYWNKEKLGHTAIPLQMAETDISQVHEGQSMGKPLIGGAFQLVDHLGRQRSNKDFRGRWLLVYFGYTYCPDICPMALDNLGALLTKLGPKAKQIQVVFVSVDPQRDTHKNLKQFLENYDSRIIGLTGTPQQIETAMAAYRVHAQKFDETDPEHYAMDHSSLIYVMSPQGQYIEAFNHLTPAEQMAEALEKNL